MTTIPIEAEVSTEQLLRAVAQLPSQEFATFVNQLLGLRAQRTEPCLNQSETALLLKINEGVSADIQRRFKKLVEKRQKEIIAPEELAELIQITEQIERHDVQRLRALEALADLRQMSLIDLMNSLGIPVPMYA